MNIWTVIGTILILTGFGLMIAKWIFGVEEVAAWTLVALVPGLFCNWLGSRQEKANG
ncbi:hypothetical protein HKD42_05510 [Altererythrobacter sp. RZ02]|uniref:Uncharacterized protein n=1 Tax=Pontixanthobacter rizhaonensis TaxID=2730337 RepID=A0A848QLB4_9SPHN|nr:hypothetical protein [Pontixanthobacter rizhaonensis]NMW31510.1 hypothetical protein [Pontixanthobacter rizhaonensis]